MTSQKKAALIAPLRILPGRSLFHAPMLSMVGGILVIFSR
jgi:hypothetical protein